MSFVQKLIFSCFISIACLLVSSMAAATSWPVFSPPDKEFLANNSLIDTASCPAGQGKLATGVSINIREKLCRTFCADTWVWKSVSDNKCHDLSAEFTFQGYEITHYRNEDGTTNYSEIVANYGQTGSSFHTFQFVMGTKPGEYWHCVQNRENSPNIMCANDTLISPKQ